MILKINEIYAQVDEIGYFINYSRSSNELYIVAWSDADKKNRIGGFRLSGEGSYVIAKDNEVVLTGGLQRPNDAKIANNGNFIINDWLFGEGLKGIFYAFDISGKILVSHSLSANLFNNGISKNGEYAVCQCCHSNSYDSSKLCFFDLNKCTLIWEIKPEIGWADSYYFDCEKSELQLIYKEKGIYRYDFEGHFIDKKKWENERINYLSAFDISNIAKNRFKAEKHKINKEIAEEIISLFERALEKNLDKYPNEKALIFRNIGEIKELLGNTLEAIHYYELALEHDEKIGIKRHLNNLKNR